MAVGLASGMGRMAVYALAKRRLADDSDDPETRCFFEGETWPVYSLPDVEGESRVAVSRQIIWLALCG